MCAETLRDGTTTTTIPENLIQCQNYDCNMDTQYGMHENYEYYLKCKLRARNEGLFTADQVREKVESCLRMTLQCSDGSKIMEWAPKEPPTLKN